MCSDARKTYPRTSKTYSPHARARSGFNQAYETTRPPNNSRAPESRSCKTSASWSSTAVHSTGVEAAPPIETACAVSGAESFRRLVPLEKILQFIVGAREAGQRLDDYLAARLTTLSRMRIAGLVERSA